MTIVRDTIFLQKIAESDTYKLTTTIGMKMFNFATKLIFNRCFKRNKSIIDFRFKTQWKQPCIT